MTDRRSGTPVVWLLTLSWVLLHIVALVLSGRASAPGAPLHMWGMPTSHVLLRLGAASPALIAMGEWQRLITHAFLHGFVLHLLLNTWVWFAVGRQLERIVGGARLWIVFVVASAAGGLLHQAFLPGLAVGASGGVFGAVGALGLWSLRSHDPAAPAARRTVLVFLLLSLVLLLVPGIGHLAHLGGLAAGAAVMALLGPRRSERPAGAVVKLVAILCLALVASAAWAQAGTDAENHRSYLDELRSVENAGHILYERPDRATREERYAFGLRLDHLRRENPFADAEAREALDGWLDAWRPIATGDVPDPFRFQADLDAARGRWAPHRDRASAASGSSR